THCDLHGCSERQPAQPCPQGLLSTPPRNREAKDGGAHCGRSQTARHPQRYAQGQDAMAARLTKDTVAEAAGGGPALGGRGPPRVRLTRSISVGVFAGRGAHYFNGASCSRCPPWTSMLPCSRVCNSASRSHFTLFSRASRSGLRPISRR